MKLEVLLSVMNLKLHDLDKMNIISKCTVINQCKKNEVKVYKNFNIYSYDETGTANSRNRGFDNITEDIIVLCDDDVVYDITYEEKIINAFKNNSKADMIIFNVINPFRKKRFIKKCKRLHIYNSLNFASYNIAFRKNSLGKIKMNNMFGPGSTYGCGEDTLFIVDFLKNKKKIYSSNEIIASIKSDNSTWFNGYNKKFFFDKGALFTAISYRFRHVLILQFLLRKRKICKSIGFFNALKEMNNGSKDYIRRVKL